MHSGRHMQSGGTPRRAADTGVGHPPPRQGHLGPWALHVHLPAPDRDAHPFGAGLPRSSLRRQVLRKSRQQAGATQPLRGLLGLGLPSYKTPSGTVAFLKDGKSLAVDASGLPRESGPDHQSRFDLAYAIAADVVACWSE